LAELAYNQQPKLEFRMSTTTTSEALQTALRHLNSGEAALAERLCRDVLQVLPDAIDARHVLALSLHEQGQHSSARALLESIQQQQPEEPGIWLHLGKVHEAEGELQAAAEAYGQQLSMSGADDAVALTSLARVQLRLGQTDAAVQLWRERLQQQPQDRNAWLQLGAVLLAAGRLEEALQHYQQATTELPDFVDAWLAQGNVLRQLQRPQDAAAAYTKALDLQPDSAPIRYNLGTAWLDRGDFATAIKWYDQALEVNPDYVHARLLRCIAQLPMLYAQEADIGAARQRYEQALDELRQWALTHPDGLKQLGRIIGFSQPFLLAYQQRNDVQLQRKYGELACKAVAASYGRFAVSPAHIPRAPANGRLRIAFVGSSFCGHSVWKAITRGWVEQLDRSRYELFAYHTSTRSDQQTDYARRLFDHFTSGAYETEEWMQRIRKDDPHLIVYPEIGMDPMSGRLAALRMAPSQCVAWGHPLTTGYPTLDYYLSGELLEPSGAGQHYTERLVCLRGTSAHYTPLTAPPAELTRAMLGLEAGDVAYLCCQNLYKYLPEYDQLLVSIAKAVPASRFVFFRNKVADEVSARFEQRVRHTFAQAGLSAERHCVFNTWLGLGEYHAMLELMDIYLDSTGFSGFNTAIEALAAGLPVVTLEGEFMRGRLAAAILRQIDVTDTLTSTPDAYVRCAIRLGLDISWRTALRERLQAALPKAYEDKKAINSLQQFIELACGHFRPGATADAASKLHDRAVRFLQAGDHAQAEPLFQQVLQLDAGHVLAHSNLGVLFMATGRPQEGIASYRKALELKPDFADAAYNLGRALFRTGRMQEATQWYERAVELYGDRSSKAHNGLGNLYRTLNKPVEALFHAEQAVRIEPDYAEAWLNLGAAFRDIGRVPEAMAAYARTLQLDSTMAAARLHRCNLIIPQGYASSEEVLESREKYAKALAELREYYLVTHREELKLLGTVATSSQPFYLPYQAMNDRDLLQLHGDLVSKAVSAAFPDCSRATEHKPARDPEGKIRVGFVMGFFRAHSVWKAIIKGWMQHLDPQRFALYAYQTQHFRDRETDVARKLCRKFVQGPMEHMGWCRTIMEDDLHVLIYPEIGMDPDAAALAALRLAPVQCATWGHPETSGLPTMDYFISGAGLEPPDAQAHYVEKLVLLPHTSACYEPLPVKPSGKTRNDFGLNDDAVLYLSCQNPFKYLPDFDEVFPRIAEQVPNCQFVFFRHKKSEGLNRMFAERLTQAFQSKGLDPERYMKILPWLDTADFHALLKQADVFLDTIGFSGFNTANEALAANLPVVTLEGEFMRGRLAAAILRQIGMDDCVTSSVSTYVKLAVDLGQQPELRSALRERLRRQLPAAYNDTAPVRALEAFLNKVTNGTEPAPVWNLLTSKVGSRSQLYDLKYVPEELLALAKGTPRLALDVGCSVGATGAWIKQRWSDCRVVGIEPNVDAAGIAQSRIDHVAVCTLEQMDWAAAGISPHSIQLLILADVLEHMYAPWQALQALKPWLAADVEVLVSLPNVRNLWVADRLLSDGTWKYDRSGILDITHIRFFSLADARRMLQETGYVVHEVRTNPDYRMLELARHQIPEGQTIDVNVGRFTMHNVTQQELLELTALQFYIRCTL